jgi:hypothetical protein
MAAAPTREDRGFLKQQVVYGVTLTYGQSGEITAISAGTKTNGSIPQAWIRWKTEAYRKVSSVYAGDKVHIDVDGGLKYKINPDDGMFTRTGGGSNVSGNVNECQIKDDVNADGDKSIIDVHGGAGEDIAFVVTFDNPTCRYRFNQATGTWERVCTP